jgi:hypothetical protein
VTAQGVVSGVLSELGAHGGRGGVLGGRGVAGSSHCEVGASEGVRRDGVHPLGVGVGVGGRRQRRGRGFWQGSSLGLLLSLESN